MSDSFDTVEDKWSYRPVLWLILVVLTVFFIWASSTKIDQQVRGVGRIVPAGKMRSIQHLEGGIIRNILVKEGQTLKKGDIIFIIENKKAQAELREGIVQADALRITLKRLEAETSNMSKKNFERKFVASFSKKVQKRYKNILKTEMQIFKARHQAFVDRINGLEDRFKQKELRMNDLKTRIVNLKSELSIAQEQLEIKKKLRKSGAISRSIYLETESKVKSFNTRVQQVQKEIPIITAERNEILNLLSETQQIKHSEIAQEANDINVDIQRMNERIGAMQDQVRRTEVTSPVNGIVNKLHMNTIGGVVQPGAQIADIIPLDETLIVEGRIKTDDRGKVYLGLPVIAKITAYDYSLYGGVKGELTYISADSFTTKQNEEFYQIKATLNAAKVSDGKALYPGMTVELSIIAEKISVLQAIMRPFRKLQSAALRDM